MDVTEAIQTLAAFGGAGLLLGLVVALTRGRG